MPLTQNDIQPFPAPLFDFVTHTRVNGYFIMNITKLIASLSLTRSKVNRSESGELVSVMEFVFEASRIPADVHLFRPEEWPYSVVSSERFLNQIRGKRLSGIALEGADVNDKLRLISASQPVS
jgi:hypothetical protein